MIVVLQLLEWNEPIPVHPTHINYHFIFNMKFNLTRKVRCVVGGHRKKVVPPKHIYASVVSRYSIRIEFLVAALNDVNILTRDIGDVYLNTSYKKKVHVTIEDDLLFGPEHRKK